MLHGSEAFFRERAETRRRVALFAAGLGLGLLAALLALLTPTLRPTVDRIDQAVRFGYLSDRERVVQHIRLEAEPGPDRALRDVGRVLEHSTLRGGNPKPELAHRPDAQPETRPRIEGPGESFEDRVARALSRHSDVPLVLADQLVVEKLVRPPYPEEARSKNIEGRVAILALVDTSGAISDVSIVSPSGDLSLDQAAVTAVWQCRFRPYRVSGVVKEVYVVIPFNFTIY
jgi:TonB family protein